MSGLDFFRKNTYSNLIVLLEPERKPMGPPKLSPPKQLLAAGRVSILAAFGMAVVLLGSALHLGWLRLGLLGSNSMEPQFLE